MNFRYLNISKLVTPGLLEILNNNIIGTPGQGMLYQHLRVGSKMNHIADPYFVNLIRANQMAGTCCFCSRETRNDGLNIRAFYIRYFSFREGFRRKSIQKKNRNGKSILKAEIESLLGGHGLGVIPGEKFFHYAYVDPKNERSALLCEEFGFETIRQYTSIIFSRLNPKAGHQHRIVEAPSEESVSELLKKFYDSFTTVSFENLEGRKYYFIKDRDNQIVAGVLVNPDHWRIHSLPGALGNIMLRLFTKIPILNKLLNYDFRFVTFDGVYCVPGGEKYLQKLFEAMLVQYKVNTAIILVDPDSNLYVTLKSLRLGVVNKLKKEVRGNVIARFVNFSEAEKNIFKSNPTYISGIDAT